MVCDGAVVMTILAVPLFLGSAFLGRCGHASGVCFMSVAQLGIWERKRRHASFAVEAALWSF